MPPPSASSATPRARLGRRRRRQVAPRLGVLQVHRRPGRRRPLARRALPLLRGGRQLLGAVGDGPGTAPDQRGGRPGGRRRAASLRARALDPRRRRPGVHRAPPRPAARDCRPHRCSRERSSSRAGACSSSAWRSTCRSSWSSRTCNGPTPAWSTFSTTCSSGRATMPSSCSCCRDRRGPTGRASGSRAGASRPSRSTRSPTRSSASCWTGSSPACRRLARARIVERAEGIPLYAIETVRGLLDKGVLERDDDGAAASRRRARRARDPSRADGTHRLPPRRARPDERRLVKECSVLGAQLPAPGDRGGLRHRPRRPRRAAELARPQGGADGPRRQAVARARPVRLHPVAHPIRRLRHVDEGRAQGAPREDRRAPAVGLSRRRVPRWPR